MLNPPLIPCQHGTGNLQFPPGSSQYSMIRQMQEHFSYTGSQLLRVQSSHREYQPWLPESTTTALPQNRYLPQTQCVLNSTTNPGHLCFPGSANHELSSNTEAELRKLSFSASLDNHSLHNPSSHHCIPHSQMHMPIDIGTHFVSPSTISVSPMTGLSISTSARNLQTELSNASRRIYEQPPVVESPELSLWRLHSHRYHPYSHLPSPAVIGQQPVSNFMPHVLSQTRPPPSPFPRGPHCDFVPRFPAASSAHHAALLALGDRLASSSNITRRCARCRCPNCLSPSDLRNANGKKEHICHFPNCGKVYGKTSHLKAHIRWHLGERPFVCNWLFCGKSFTRSDELQRHLRTHTGEKKFQCQICEKKFMRSDHLSKHVKIHKKKSSSPTNSDHDKSKSDLEKQSSPTKENELQKNN